MKITDVTVKEFKMRASITWTGRTGPLWEGSLNGKKLQVKKVSRDGEDSAVVFLQLDGKKWKQLAQVLTKWFEGDVHSQRVRAVMAATALCDKIQCKHIEATDDVIKPERNRLVAHYGGQVNKAGYNKRSATADGGEAACDAAPKNQKSVPKAQKAMPKEGGKPKRCRRADTGDDEGKEEKKDKEEGQGEVEQEESGKEKETVKEVQESEKEKGQEADSKTKTCRRRRAVRRIQRRKSRRGTQANSKTKACRRADAGGDADDNDEEEDDAGGDAGKGNEEHLQIVADSQMYSDEELPPLYCLM